MVERPHCPIHCTFIVRKCFSLWSRTDTVATSVSHRFAVMDREKAPLSTTKRRSLHFKLATEVGPEVLQRPVRMQLAESKRHQSWSFLNHGFFRIDEERPYQRAGEQNARRDEEWSDPHPPLN